MRAALRGASPPTSSIEIARTFSAFFGQLLQQRRGSPQLSVLPFELADYASYTFFSPTVSAYHMGPPRYAGNP